MIPIPIKTFAVATLVSLFTDSCTPGTAHPDKIASDMGIGLLTVNTVYDIPLYANEADPEPLDVLKFATAASGVTTFNTRLTLKPYQLFEGNPYKGGQENRQMGLIHFPPVLKFRVLDSTVQSFKVVTDEGSGQSYFIKRNPANAYYITEAQLYDNNCANCPGSSYNPRWYIFETWERYLKRVEFIEKPNIVIYDQPEGKIIFESKKEAFLPFSITEVKGDWIRLKKGLGREFNFEKSKNYDGWTQWKAGNQMLIRIIEHTYE